MMCNRKKFEFFVLLKTNATQLDFYLNKIVLCFLKETQFQQFESYLKNQFLCGFVSCCSIMVSQQQFSQLLNQELSQSMR
jgi:hypothetical protein